MSISEAVAVRGPGSPSGFVRLRSRPECSRTRPNRFRARWRDRRRMRWPPLRSASDATGCPRRRKLKGGAGFDVVQHDGLRSAVRSRVAAASYGQSAVVNFDAMASNLFPRAAGSRLRPSEAKEDIAANRRQAICIVERQRGRCWNGFPRKHLRLAVVLSVHPVGPASR